MIHVERLNGERLVVNADLIETMEAAPDTVITLTTGRRFLVREGVETLIELVLEYRRRCAAAPGAARKGDAG